MAVFGCGDQHGYGDYFCDAMEELHSSFAAAAADMVGLWPTQGYEHSESKVREQDDQCSGSASYRLLVTGRAEPQCLEPWYYHCSP